MISHIDRSGVSRQKHQPFSLRHPSFWFHSLIKQKMAMLRAFLRLAFIAILVKSAIGTNHTVGGTSGWDIGNSLQTWAAGQTFHVGDNLVFTYSPPHNVLEVKDADYSSCTTTSPVKAYADPNTAVVALTSPGNRYFICGFIEHCGQGMKLQVQTLASHSSATAPSTTTATPPSTPATVAAPPLPHISSPPAPAISKPPSTLPKATPPLSSLAPSLEGAPPLPSLAPVPSGLPTLPPLATPPTASSDSATSPPPAPSSANRGRLLSTITTGMLFGMLMLLAI